jgi:membrane protein implicated in regulation of membrane protease activity
LTADQVVDRCRTYWLGSGIAEAAAREMAAELRSHIEEAASAGKAVDAVTGSDIDAFAEEWAAASRGPTPKTPPAQRPLPRTDANQPTWGLWLGLAAIVALVIAVALFGPRDEAMNQAGWTATWLIAAAVLAIGEMLTAGFFLLPFAAGAATAGVLALLSVSVATQIITFVVVSVLALWLIQRFAKKDIHGELLPVGAARYIGASAVVIEPVSRLHGTGMVKLGLQDWRATTDGDRDIPVDTEVRITEVRGARLVVESID